jgi:hypothetical protein
MIPALFIAVYIGSPRRSGKMAFLRVKRLLEQSFDRRRYSQFHGIRLPTGGGTEDADHILVSRFGVFIVVSEHRPGVLRGGESQQDWIQERLGRKRSWPNPLYRGKLQMEVLQRILDMPRKYFEIFVAVSGQDKPFKSLPERVIPANRLVSVLRSKTDQLLSLEQADRVAKMIAEAALERRIGITRTAVAQWLIAVVVFIGVLLVYGDDIRKLAGGFESQVDRWANPEQFHESGTPKSEQQLFEESVVCAYSEDTQRCSCYEKGGDSVAVEFSRCRELAERGSILRQ